MMREWRSNLALWLLVGFVLLAVSSILILVNGAVKVPTAEVWQSFTDFDKSNQLHQIIRNLRLPRLLGGILVGAALATSGTLMQGVTHNPLADAGLLGINAGAGLGLALTFVLFQTPSQSLVFVAAILGAGISVGLIFFVAKQTKLGMSPLRMTLVGAGISALFVALSQALALQFDLGQDLLFWTLGGVAVITWSQLQVAAPIFMVALLLAVMNASSVTILRFGDEAAISLGKNPQRLRLLLSLVVLLLAGTAVALVGAISFVGLIVPHFLRRLVGDNYRKLVPLSIVGGALLVIWADFLARIINPPFETPFGILIAVIGIPFFLLLSRKGGIGG